MNYYDHINLKEKDFKRYFRIRKNTFHEMIEILTQAEQKKKKLGGEPNLLTLEQRLMMTLEYLKEYRIYSQIAKSYGISESSCCRITKWIQDVLSEYPDLKLEDKKKFLEDDYELSVSVFLLEKC